MMTNNSTMQKFQEKKHHRLSILNGIAVKKPSILDALSRFSREIFIPDTKKNLSCLSNTFLINRSRALLSADIIARILNHIHVDLDKSCLVVGCGTGYLASVLSELYSNVFAVEPISSLHDTAKENFSTLEIDNIILLDSLKAKSIEQQAPYDLIFIEGVSEKIPTSLFDQLSNHGQLLSYLPVSKNLSKVICFEKKDSFWEKKVILEMWAPEFEEFKSKDTFTF